MRSALYEGTLLHARTAPARNVFRYPVCFYGLDLDELPELDRRLRLFGYNRPDVLTFRDADHMGDPARPVKENVTGFLAEHGIDLGGRADRAAHQPAPAGLRVQPGQLLLLLRRRAASWRRSSPRWATPSASATPTCSPPRTRCADGSRRVYEHDKRMHVSPFFGMDQTYRFSFTEPGERVHAGVGIIEGGERPFWAELDRAAPAPHQRGRSPGR